MLCGEQIEVSPPAMFGVNALCTIPFPRADPQSVLCLFSNYIASHAGRGGRHDERSKITG
jgi:hypothetical protein